MSGSELIIICHLDNSPTGHYTRLSYEDENGYKLNKNEKHFVKRGKIPFFSGK